MVVIILLFLAGLIGFLGGWIGRSEIARADARDYDATVLAALRRIGVGRG